MSLLSLMDKSVILRRKTSGTGSKVESWVDISYIKGCIFPTSSAGSMIGFQTYLRTDVSHIMYCKYIKEIPEGYILVDIKYKSETIASIPYRPISVSVPTDDTNDDIRIGDKIIYGSDEYLVKRIMPWSHSGLSFYKVYLAEIK